jgi:hypothetical protein
MSAGAFAYHGLPPEAAKQRRVARVTGLEPAASGVTGRRSNQLSYTRIVSLRRRAPLGHERPLCQPLWRPKEAI